MNQHIGLMQSLASQAHQRRQYNMSTASQRNAAGEVLRKPYLGFTFIELLAVLVVIALLLSVVVPNYMHHIDHASEVALKQDLFTVRDSIDKFKADKARCPANLQELVTSNYLRTIPEDPITGSADTWIAKPVPEGELCDIQSGSPARAQNGTLYASW